MKSAKLRIDYFNDFPLVLQGAESIHVYEICKQFQQLGCEVCLFSPAPPTLFDTKFCLVAVRTPRFLKSFFYQLFLLPKVAKHWSHNKPDAIYMRVSPFLFMPVLLAKLYGIPLYVEINGTLHLELDKAHTLVCHLLLLFHITDMVESLAYRQAKQVITVTSSLKDYIISRFHIAPIKISVVSNGVDADRLRPFPVKAVARGITIGYVGGLMWWQGLEYVLEAFALKKSALKNARLVIYGDGPERENLIQHAERLNISHQVDFPGRIDYEQVASVINSFDICIAYYVKARAGLNSPFKVYEYLACAKPVIVSDTAGIGNIFFKVADVAPAEDSKALGEHIVRLIHDRSRQKKLSLAARGYILAGHTWHDSAHTILGLINSSGAEH